MSGVVCVCVVSNYMFPVSVCCVCVCVRVCETHCRHKKRVKEIQQKLKEMEVAGNVSSPTPFH